MDNSRCVVLVPVAGHVEAECERALVHLATSPPSPYREQASIERAGALVDVGDREGAVAIASALHASTSLPDVARASLSRLDDRLRASAH